jgi:hypothetical protein
VTFDILLFNYNLFFENNRIYTSEYCAEGVPRGLSAEGISTFGGYMWSIFDALRDARHFVASQPFGTFP